MKRLIAILLSLCFAFAYPGTASAEGSSAHNSFQQRKKQSRKATKTKYIRGPRGGCYYINGNGNKTYVDRSLCN